MLHSTAKTIVDKHEQRYAASCSSSAIEMILKIHGKIPITDYSLQNKFQNQNVGFGPFANQTIHGVTFRQDSDMPPFKKLKNIIAGEHAAGRCVVVSTKEPHGGFHIWITTEPDGIDARALTKCFAQTEEALLFRDRLDQFPHGDFLTYIL